MSDIESRVLQSVLDTTGADGIVRASHLSKDFNADSLDMVEIQMALEDEFNIELRDDEFSKWVKTDGTVGGLVELVRASVPT